MEKQEENTLCIGLVLALILIQITRKFAVNMFPQLSSWVIDYSIIIGGCLLFWWAIGVVWGWQQKKRNKVNNGLEIREIHEELQNASSRYNNSGFKIVCKIIETTLNDKPKKIIEMIRSSNERTSLEWLYSTIGNISGDLIESGEYHVYRGALDITGNELLSIFDDSYDQLLNMKTKDIDIEYATKQKSTLRKNIKKIG